MRIPAGCSREATRRIVVATLLVLLPLLGACDAAEGREVLAHYDSGVPETRSTEVDIDGRWIRHGPFEAYHPDGTLRARGAFLRGEQDGEWTQWYANGARGSRGRWDAGEKQGHWAYWNEEGVKIAEGEYRGEREGAWQFWYADGTPQARGSFLFGKKEGLWIHRDADGTVDQEQSGVYEDGVKVADVVIDGRKTEWYDEDRPRDVNTLVDGVRHGPSASWYPDGSKRYEGEFEHGRKTGRWTYWNADGTVDEERSGKYDGWRRIAR